MRFVLASASPARLATLRAAGLEPEVVVSGVDETAVTAPSTVELVQRLAERKAHAVASTPAGDGSPAAVVLGCDSLLEFDGEALGKPGDAATARDRWRRMRGGRGVLHTGHCLIDTASGRVTGGPASAGVRFADVEDDEIDRYVATGEPVAVAGAFTVDGLGGWFVESVDGDPHAVVGVSLPLVRRLLRELGLGLVDLGYPVVQRPD